MPGFLQAIRSQQARNRPANAKSQSCVYATAGATCGGFIQTVKKTSTIQRSLRQLRSAGRVGVFQWRIRHLLQVSKPSVRREPGVKGRCTKCRKKSCGTFFLRPLERFMPLSAYFMQARNYDTLRVFPQDFDPPLLFTGTRTSNDSAPVPRWTRSRRPAPCASAPS
ncbi:hypothetical protein SDC9_188402 [bioreactor metagenome]|uniref:Uncharacterized protein n=1 Tax=bioreactor metagenome TaxID=1076179 RepID=A0A645HQY8_9ZZZZ